MYFERYPGWTYASITQYQSHSKPTLLATVAVLRAIPGGRGYTYAMRFGSDMERLVGTTVSMMWHCCDMLGRLS